MSASVRDVAKRAGVSVGTVSNVLNHPEKVSAATVKRVKTAIRDLGFVRNDAARQLRAGKSRSIGLVVLDLANPFFTDLGRGVEARADLAGLTVLVGNSAEDAQRERRYLEQFEQQRLQGILLTPRGEAVERLVDLREQGIAVVLVDREAGESGFSSVAVDDEAGGVLAAKHLLEIGRRRIAYVAGPTAIRQVSDRLRGLNSATANSGASVEVIEVPALSLACGRRAGDEIAARPERERPDAIFAANDLLAIGLLQGLMSGHVAVPEDIAIIGYDDIEFASAAVIPLSSVRQPAYAMGESAFDLLIDEANALSRGEVPVPRRVVFEPELVVRNSTRP